MLAAQTEKSAKEKIKRYYDRTSQNRTFLVGDLVLVLLPSSTNKLLAKWQGPFPVVEKFSETTYRVRMEGSSRPMKIYHINMLKVWEAPSAVCLVASFALEEGQEMGMPTCTGARGLAETHINPDLEEDQKTQTVDAVAGSTQRHVQRPTRQDTRSRH